jgi:hypothetical protein
MNKPTTDADALRGIAAFLPKFKAAGLQFGHWTEPSPGEGGSIVMPYVVLSDEASSFVQAACDLGWVRSELSQWPNYFIAVRAGITAGVTTMPELYGKPFKYRYSRGWPVLMRVARFVDKLRSPKPESTSQRERAPWLCSRGLTEIET